MQSHKSLQLHAYEFIKNKILRGELNYNEIYSETKIARDLSISKTPVRDAVQYLSQEKYVDIIPNKGFNLHEMSKQDFVETSEIRSAIEGYCVSRISIEHTTDRAKETFNELNESLEKQKAAINKSVDEFFDADRWFHSILVSYAKNEEFINLIKNHSYRIRNFIIRSLAYEGRMESAYSEHLDIYEQIKNGDTIKSYESVLFHMDNSLMHIFKVAIRD